MAKGPEGIFRWIIGGASQLSTEMQGTPNISLKDDSESIR
jgi:hypothetical protein